MENQQISMNKLASNVDNNITKQPIEINKLYRAKVVDVKDPYKRGRIKVWITGLMGRNVEDDNGCWASPANNIFSGNKDFPEDRGLDDCGSLIIPPKNTYVFVIFENGDFSKARYINSLNLSEIDESVPVENQSGKEYWNKWTMIKTPKGRQILVSDDPDDESVIIRGKYLNRSSREKGKKDPRLPKDSMYMELYEKSGEEYAIVKVKPTQYVLLDKTNNIIRLQHPSGSFIEFTSSGDIVIQSAGKVKINCLGSDSKEHL